MGIKILDKQTAEQIAAGEVIENPASVVKELTENALDAESTRIEIEISNGGKNKITVSDNGQGIPGPELPLAFQRFATSKLSVIDDLNRLYSLGFRGEALSSIAAVARVKLISRTGKSISGSQILIDGGEIKKQEEVGAPFGTRVEVTDLFYNTPGRLKFLRSDSAETMRISALLAEMALAHPAVAFSLTSGKRKLFSSPGDGILLNVVGAVYGNETAESLLEVNRKDQSTGYRISGFISAPHLNRSSRRWITIIVNGRLVKNPMIVNALERGYGDYLPRQRHPLAILNISVPPDTIDVNVHPAKVEIRFQDPESIRSLLYKTIKLVLQSSVTTSNWPQETYRDYNHLTKLSGQADLWKESSISYQQIRYEAPYIHTNDGGPDELSPDPEITAGGDYRLIGQYLQSYLVVENNDDLLLIDQHAAHERIIYQQLINRAQSAACEPDSQLTIPLTIELPFVWRSKMPSLLPFLRSSGFHLDPISDDSYAVRAVPFVYSREISDSQLNSIMETIFNALDDNTADYRETILKTIACHRAVKAKQFLTRAEMEKLLSEWLETERAQYCPHGRPTVISFNRALLERSFNRKGS